MLSITRNQLFYELFFSVYDVLTFDIYFVDSSFWHKQWHICIFIYQIVSTKFFCHDKGMQMKWVNDLILFKLFSSSPSYLQLSNQITFQNGCQLGYTIDIITL